MLREIGRAERNVQCAPPPKGGCDLDGWISPAVPFSRRLKKKSKSFESINLPRIHSFKTLTPSYTHAKNLIKSCELGLNF